MYRWGNEMTDVIEAFGGLFSLLQNYNKRIAGSSRGALKWRRIAENEQREDTKKGFIPLFAG